jgi:tetratricopeptide (TPR) repeat protein
MLNLCELEYEDGIRSMIEGRYRKAASKLKSSLERATNEGLLLQRMRSMFAYIEVLTLSGQIERAEKLICSTIQESEKMFAGKDAIFHALTLSSAARHYFLHLQDLNRALPALKAATVILNTSPASHVIPEFVEVYFRLHDCLLALGQLEQAVETAEDAVVFCKRRLGQNDASVPFSYFLLLSTLRQMGCDENASFFRQLVKEFEHHCGKIKYDKADLIELLVTDGDCRERKFGLELKRAFHNRE